MGNNAIADNPPSLDEDITVQGDDWIWTIFCIMAASGLGVTVLAYAAPIGKRAFHWMSVAILFTASVAYYTMASNLGKTGIRVEFVRNKEHLWTGGGDPYRAIYYARYIDWTITTPLLLLDLLLATGLPLSTIFFTIFMDLVMIITGLCGALTASQYKWGYYAFGCAAMFYVFWILIGPARQAAKALGEDNHKVYMTSALVLSFLWFCYPISWGLCEGGNVISPDSEFIFYGILDVLAKPGFIILHLIGLSKIEYERFSLQSGHFSTGASDATYNHKNIPFAQMKQAPANNRDSMATATGPVTATA